MKTKKNYRLFFSTIIVLVYLMAKTQASADSSSGHVYLSGQVHREGAVEIPDGGTLTVVQAIILDGGLGDFAEPHHIKILRKKSDGSTQVILVDWVAIVGGSQADHPLEQAHLDKDVPVQAGDIIVVPKKLQNY